MGRVDEKMGKPIKALVLIISEQSICDNAAAERRPDGHDVKQMRMRDL